MRKIELALCALMMIGAAGTAAARGGGGGHGGGHSGGGHVSGGSHVSSGHVNSSSHAVRGYTKKNGTYVAPSHATNPNGTKTDNYSAKGNVNPYTGKAGTKDPGK